MEFRPKNISNPIFMEIKKIVGNPQTPKPSSCIDLINFENDFFLHENIQHGKPKKIPTATLFDLIKGKNGLLSHVEFYHRGSLDSNISSSTLGRSLELMNKGNNNPIQSRAVSFAVMAVDGFHCDLATLAEVGKDSDPFDKVCIRTVFNKIVPPNSCHMKTGSAEGAKEFDHWSFTVGVSKNAQGEEELFIEDSHMTPTRFVDGSSKERPSKEVDKGRIKPDLRLQSSNFDSGSNNGVKFLDLFIPINHSHIPILPRLERLQVISTKGKEADIEKAYILLLEELKLKNIIVSFKNLAPNIKNLDDAVGCFLRISFIALIGERPTSICGLDDQLMVRDGASQVKVEPLSKACEFPFWKSGKSNVSICMHVHIIRPLDKLAPEEFSHGTYAMGELRTRPGKQNGNKGDVG